MLAQEWLDSHLGDARTSSKVNIKGKINFRSNKLLNRLIFSFYKNNFVKLELFCCIFKSYTCFECVLFY